MSKRTLEENHLYTDSSHSKEIVFSSHFEGRKMRLIELPKHVTEYIENGGHLELKGKEDGKDSVLCTDTMTFDIKKVENSNTLYIVSPSNDNSFPIEGSSTAFYEVWYCNKD
jgi:hypothetical protein